MRFDRRQVLRGGLCAAAAGLAPQARAAFAHPLGFQAYAVRDALLQDFTGTLRRIAAFGYQLVLVCAALMASYAIGIGDEVGFTALLVFLPAVLIAQVLPIGISGLGIREGAFVVFLHPLGVPAHSAIAFGLLLYLLTLVASLAGAPSFALGGPKAKSSGGRKDPGTPVQAAM